MRLALRNEDRDMATIKGDFVEFDRIMSFRACRAIEAAGLR